jgi:CRISPR-associated protein Cas8a1/Csx13
MRSIHFRVDDPNYTNYHRAAVGGLAATIAAFQKMPDLAPEGLSLSFDEQTVTIEYPDDMKRGEVFRRMLAASFRVDSNHLIDMPGQLFGTDDLSLRYAVHQGIIKSTFCQHNLTFTKVQKERMLLTLVKDDKKIQLPYIAVKTYAHQYAGGTGLLPDVENQMKAKKKPKPDSDDEPEVVRKNGEESNTAFVRQHLVPGAMSGAKMIEASSEDVFLLCYLMVACPVFIIPPNMRLREKNSSYCIIIPDIIDLVRFSRSVERMASVAAKIKQTDRLVVAAYINRIVAAGEEAALKFLMQITGDDIRHAADAGIQGCSAVSMGRVAWDPQQNNRTGAFRVGTRFPEIEIFRAAQQHLGEGKLILTKNDTYMEIANSLVPGLIATNLINRRHWATGFDQLIPDQDSFDMLVRYQRKGLAAMKNAVQDELDRLFIEAVQIAWRNNMGKIAERARREHANFSSLVDSRREEIRNDLNQARTSDKIQSWLMGFLSEAGHIEIIKANGERFQKFVFDPHNFLRIKNLAIFSFISYVPVDKTPVAAPADGAEEADLETEALVVA